MNELKRWAKTYLLVSPLFRSHLFEQPRKEHIMKINFQLSAAYAIKMYKYCHYNQQQALEVLHNNHFNHKQYWTVLSHSLLSNKVQQTITDSQDKLRFCVLLCKFFHKSIKLDQFKQLANLYLSLILKEEITEFDNVVIDLSFYSLGQLSVFAALGIEAAVDAIDIQAIKFLARAACETYIADIFSMVLTLQRIKSKLQAHKQLQLLLQWLLPTAKPSNLLSANPSYHRMLYKQTLPYLLWLLHIQELGEFVHKYTKKNYIYSQYIEGSVSIMVHLLEAMPLPDKSSISEAIILGEVVDRMEKGVEDGSIRIEAKKIKGLDQRLKKVKQHFAKLVKQATHVKLGLDGFQQLQKLDMLQINFVSAQSKRAIKDQLQTIINSEYFKILVKDEQIPILSSLLIKIEEYALNRKLLQKRSNIEKYASQKRSLLQCLEEVVSTSTTIVSTSTEIEQASSLQIKNIYELKRIKMYLKLLKINKRSQNTHPFITRHRLLLRLLDSQLSKSARQLEQQPLELSLTPFFLMFMK